MADRSMDDVDVILSRTSRLPDDASLARVGLARYAGAPMPRYSYTQLDRGAMGPTSSELDQYCAKKPYTGKDGLVHVNALERQCVTHITGITDPNHRVGDADFDKITKWVLSHGMWGSPDATRTYITVVRARLRHWDIFTQDVRFSDFPENFAITPDPSSPASNTISDVANFALNPINWLAMGALAISVPVILFALYQLTKTEPTGIGAAATDTTSQATQQAMNYLPGKKAITIIR